MRTRGFEVAKGFDENLIALPTRKTTYSAGYDIAAAADYLIKPMQMVKVSTGIKAYMQPDEFLGIHVRSSIAIKHSVMLANSQGIIDADYYQNPDNDGHIIIALLNLGTQDFVIKQGERIAQGIFYKYLTVDDEAMPTEQRLSGTGSTGK